VASDLFIPTLAFAAVLVLTLLSVAFTRRSSTLLLAGAFVAVATASFVWTAVTLA
jgi:hypothetical protein